MAKQEKIALVLQGGGALGAYQAGAFEALTAGDYCPEWFAGISIGAINAAIICGHPRERRVARLREFLDRVTSVDPARCNPTGLWGPIFADASANLSATFGVPGVFHRGFRRPRRLGPIRRRSWAFTTRIPCATPSMSLSISI